MKKFFLTLALSVMVLPMFAQEDKPEKSQAIADLELASNLAKYGYENNSASALYEAVSIYMNVATHEPSADFVYERGEGASDSKTGTAFSVKKVLNDALAFAKGDKALTKKINALLKSSESVTRGRVNGPSETDECVLANSTDTYRIKFRGGETAEVLVMGDGDTDLDLYVYDENGNLIDKDIDSTDTMLCMWTPKWTGEFIIKIKNLGSVRNYYTMWTN